MKKWNSRQKNALLRGAVQLVFFLTMPSAFVAGFSGVKYIFTQIGNGAVLEQNSFLMALIGLLAYTIVFGRFFCGYICSFGALGDLVYALSGLFQKKVLGKKKVYRLPAEILPRAQKIKYGILALIVILCAMGVYGRLSGTSPWDVFSMVTVLRIPSGYTAGILILAAILVGMALQERFFCQFLCPMGALFAMMPILPTSVPERREAECLPRCRACTVNCPAALRLEADSSSSGECIRCGKCAGICPKSNISTCAGRLSGNEIWFVLVRAGAFFLLGTLIGI